MHCLAFLKGREASQKTSYHKDRPLQSRADSLWPPKHKLPCAHPPSLN
jgi:hypothetical protein